MIEYVKRKFPSVYVYTSTNGLPLTEEKIVRIIEAGLDEITFSVDGPDQKTYSRYRRGGDFEKVMRIMARFCPQTRCDRAGGAFRQLAVYPLPLERFVAEDEKNKKARRPRSASTASPGRSPIIRRTPIRSATGREPAAGDGSTTKSGTRARSARPSPAAGIRRPFRSSIAGLRSARKRGGRLPRKVRARNTGGALWRDRTYSGRRLVRLGAQLFDKDRKLANLNFARAFLPRPLRGGESEIIGIELPPLAAPGDFWLKFDMVSEGIDWFESGGSPVTWIPFRVE